MSLDERLTRAAHHVADGVAVPDVDLDAVRSRARTKRRASLAAAGAAVAAAAVVASVLLADSPERRDPAPVDPDPPKVVVVPQVPVWYDDAGLHHGRRVDPTPVDLLGTQAQEDDFSGGVLTLVRTGALYRDPATDDVWWHPWAGRPRVVGEDSATGPGGDPLGDVAAWFEGDELVVYDTARGREISRTSQTEVAAPMVSDHLASGYGFRHVSDEEVVWRSEDVTGHGGVHRLDLATGQVSVLFRTTMYEDETRGLEDVHGDTRVWTDTAGEPLVFRYPGGETVAPPGVEPMGRLNADGSLLLSPTEIDGSHGAAVVDVRTGETWPFPVRKFYAWISWSYGDLAVVGVQRDRSEGLMACDAVTRECEDLPRQGDVLLPSS